MDGTVNWVRREDGRGLRGGIPGADATGGGAVGTAALTGWVIGILEAVEGGADCTLVIFAAGFAILAEAEGGLAGDLAGTLTTGEVAATGTSFFPAAGLTDGAGLTFAPPATD